MIKYLNTFAKSFVVLIFSLVSFGLFIISSLLATQICKKWYGLAIGIIMMLIAIPFHCIGKKAQWGYLISFVINSFACGFVASAYYLEAEITLKLYQMFMGAVPAAAILFLVYLMLQSFNKTKKVTVTVAAIINAILTITAAFLWIKHGDIAYSFGFFSSLIGFFYLCVFVITINHDERSVFRDISFESFGSFIIITVVVIFIISEGDVLDGFDLDLSDIRNKKDKKK